MTRSRAAVVQFILSILLLAACPLSAFAIDTDGDGVDDSVDAFPNHKEASVDTDGDGMPDAIVEADMPLLEDFETSLQGWTLSSNAGQSSYKVYKGAYAGGLVSTSDIWSGTLSKSTLAGTIVYYASATSISGTLPLKPFRVDGAVQTPTCVTATPIASQDPSNAGNWFKCTVITSPAVHTLEWTIGAEGPFLGTVTFFAVDEIAVSTLTIDIDDDNDGVLDVNDAFPFNSAEQYDTDSDGAGNNADPDDDNDGVLDGADNCPTVAPADQLDTDADGQGNLCDSDDDNDSVSDADELTILGSNPLLADTDGDGVNDASDNCPIASNPDQLDANNNGEGDVCDLSVRPSWLAAGSYHTCAVTAIGTVKCWGANYNNQLGDGTTVSQSEPVNVVGLSDIAAIRAGVYHACAITDAGSVACWGYNTNGQLGDGTTINRSTAVLVNGVNGASADVAPGHRHTCILTDAGGVKCWGYGFNGQLGQGFNVDSVAPVGVSGLSAGVVAIASGEDHSCALTLAGGVKCWGYNTYGQLGDGTIINRNVPVNVSGLNAGVLAIAAGNSHTCAITMAGGVKCWGRNLHGQLGDGSETDRKSPVDVVGLASGMSMVAAGSAHTCVLANTGGVKCWGSNGYGELGDGTVQVMKQLPVNVVGLQSGVIAIDIGGKHSCALTDAGDVQCWGYNYYGQLGNGTTTNSSTPVNTVGSFYVPDTDGDGVPDISDVFPLNAAESVDTDLDGTGNNADPDDDNDGLPDVMDPLPLQAKFNRDANYHGSQVRDAAQLQ